MRRLITGSAGFICRHLIRKLERLVVLGRNIERINQLPGEVTACQWNPGEQIPSRVFAGVDTGGMELMKKIVKCTFSAACLALVLSSCSAMPEGNATNGERWFKLYRCIGCHGKGGSGGRGPVIAGISLSHKQFLHKLRNPRSAVMPTFTSQHVSDQDAADIYQWLKQQKK